MFIKKEFQIIVYFTEEIILSNNMNPIKKHNVTIY